ARGGILTASMPAAANTASKAAVNFESRSRMTNRNRWACSSRSISRLRAAWVDPSVGRVGGDPGQVGSAAVEFDHEEDVQAGQPDGFDGEEVTGEGAGGLGAQELDPGWTAAAGAGPKWWRRRMVRTDVADTATPSLRHSPTMCTYPQRGFPAPGAGPGRPPRGPTPGGLARWPDGFTIGGSARGASATGSSA